ncbi:MAG: hypothetical protein AAF805_03405 [Planctomycetota bacterium]
MSDSVELQPHRAAYGLRVNAYDRTSSLLVALLLLVGAAVVGLLVVFLSAQIPRTPPAIPVTTTSASRAAAPGDPDDTLPGVENAPEQLQSELEQTLDRLALAASDPLLFREDASADAASLRRGESGGDSRGVGTDVGDGDASREPVREIRFEPASFEEYARWFDAAGLELGVLGADNRVYYASGLSRRRPRVRTGDPVSERRLYFNSRSGPLASLDERLAKKAGIADRGDVILQFCRPATQQTLLALEREAAGGRPTTEVVRTVFRVEKSGSDYRFRVEEQTYYR